VAPAVQVVVVASASALHTPVVLVQAVKVSRVVTQPPRSAVAVAVQAKPVTLTDREPVVTALRHLLLAQALPEQVAVQAMDPQTSVKVLCTFLLRQTRVVAVQAPSILEVPQVVQAW
jgi:hypothetical protein